MLLNLFFLWVFIGGSCLIGTALFRVSGLAAPMGPTLLIGTVLGFGSLALLILILGLLGQLTLVTALALWLFLTVLTLPVLHGSIRGNRQRGEPLFSGEPLFKRGKWGRGVHLYWLLALIITTHAVGNLVGALAPPTYADSMAYHLSVPEQYVQSGRIFYIPDVQANQPQLMHMLYALGLLVSDELPILFSYFASVLAALGLYFVGSLLYAPLAGLIAAALFYAMPMFTLVSSSGHVETGLVVFVVAAVYCIARWHQTQNVRWMGIAGVCLGFAMGTKLYGPISLLALAIASPLLLHGEQQRVVKAWLVPLLLLGAVAVGVAAPWYLKTWIMTGNPLYPAFYTLFGGRDWSPHLNAAVEGKLDAASGAGRSWLDLLLLPWNLTMNGAAFNAGRGGIGPGFLALLPAVPLAWRFRHQRKLSLFLLAYVIIFTLIWFFVIVQRGRHLLPALGVLSVLIGGGMAALWSNQQFWARAVVVTGLAFPLLFGLGVNGVYNLQFVPVVVGAQAEDDYLRTKLSFYEDVEWINEHLPTDARIMVLDRSVNYYLEVDYFGASPLSQAVLDWQQIEDVHQLRERLAELSVTHVLVDMESLHNRRYAIDPTSPEAEHLSALLEGLLIESGELIYRRSGNRVGSRTLGDTGSAVDMRVYLLDNLRD